MWFQKERKKERNVDMADSKEILLIGEVFILYWIKLMHMVSIICRTSSMLAV